MEEDVGPGSGLGVSKMPLSGELPAELLSESMGSENHVEGSYEEGDEGEIMVEIVGSDVFVNGVSGHNGDLEGHEWENTEENTSQKTSEAMDVWNEGDVLDEEVWNPEISAMVVASSTVIESVVISEEKVVKCEAADTDSDNFVKSELLNHCMETIIEGNIQTLEKEEILADLAQLDADSVMFHHATNASDGAQIVPSELSHGEDQDNVQFGGIDIAVGEVVLVIATEEGEVAATDTPNDGENKVFSAESKDSIVEVDAILSNSEKNLSNEETIKLGSLFRMYHPDYLSNPTNEGHYGLSDLVWGEVRNHLWWPGQIFDQADASEKAMKYHRKDSHLVAYFGEQTFAWNDASVLRPFMPYFSHIEKQSNSEAFQSAVTSALEVVSRRVELGLTCSCIPKDVSVKIGTQVIENPGIREESSQRRVMNHSTSFEPDKLLDYIRNLATCASSSADRLDLVHAKAQLFAFYRFKGYRSPTEFLSSMELRNIDLNTEHESSKIGAACKRRCTPMDDSHSKKERSLTELMADKNYSPDAEDDFEKSVSPRKGKTFDHLANGMERRVNIHAAKLSTSMDRPPRPSVGISQCVNLVASQLTGSASLVKENNDAIVIDGSSVAQNPEKTQNIQNSAHAFIWDYRNQISNKQDRKRKAEPTVGGLGEGFEFDDANDSYWKDRVVQNHSGEQPSFVKNYPVEQLRHDWQNRTANPQPVAEKLIKTWHTSQSSKRLEPDDNVKRQKQGFSSSPAELILNFAEGKHVPSEINLNKTFRRFGSLMESETEADRESGRAKVIFKRGSDAEVALNSAGKFNIFGPVLVKYQIGYSPLISVKISSLAIPQCSEGETFML